MAAMQMIVLFNAVSFLAVTFDYPAGSAARPLATATRCGADGPAPTR